MSKTRKEILKELLDLENENLEEVEEQKPTITPMDEKNESIQAVKAQRSQKQLEAFEKAKKIRDENAKKRKEERKIKEEEERKIIAEKLVKKAISLKKKEIKKQAILDEISDDETPIEKVKEIAQKQKHGPLKQHPGKTTSEPIIRFY